MATRDGGKRYEDQPLLEGDDAAEAQPEVATSKYTPEQEKERQRLLAICFALMLVVGLGALTVLFGAALSPCRHSGFTTAGHCFTAQGTELRVSYNTSI